MRKGKLLLFTMAILFAFTTMPPLAEATWVSIDGSATPEKPSVDVLHSDAFETVIQFTTGGFIAEQITEEGEVFDAVRFPYYYSTAEIGKPQLPAITELVAIPAGVNVKVSVVGFTETILNGYHVYPFQTPLIEGEKRIKFDIDSDFYGRDEFYPALTAEAGEPGIWRDLRVVGLRIYPMQHNPQTGELKIYDKITVKLEYYGTSDRNTLEPGNRSITARYDKMYRSGVLNYEHLGLAVETDTPEKGGSASRDAYNYLIVAADQWVDNMTALADYKTSIGLATQVISLSAIAPDADTLAIRNYIKQEYLNNGIQYALLVGNYDDLPCYELWQYSYDTIYSDFYYALLDGDDDYPEIAVGRFSVSTDTEADNMVNKSITYESSPPQGDWLENVLLVAHKEDAPGKYQGCKEQIRTAEETVSGTYQILYPNFTTAYGAWGYNGGDEASNADVSAAINSGQRVVNYRGHGGTAIWGLGNPPGWNIYSEDYDTITVDALSNGEKTPVIFGIACSSNQINWGGGRCLGEAFTRGAQGGVAYLGATRPSWTSENHIYDKKLFSLVFDEGVNAIGDASNLAAIKIIDLPGNDGLENARLYLWLGDPSLNVIYMGHTPTVIHVPADQPTIQAGIDAATDGDSVLVASGTYSGSGNVNVSFSGKEIVVLSEEGAASTIIDCQGNSRAFYFNNSETNFSKLSGFTIEGGNETFGGGIYIYSASPVIEDCVIRNCQANNGGGINVLQAGAEPALLVHVLFYDNNAAMKGGAVYVQGGNCQIENCTFTNNTALTGAAVSVNDQSTTLSFTHNIVADNINDGLYCDGSGSVVTFDCNVFWNNPNGHVAGDCTFPVDELEARVADPGFCDSDNDDFTIYVDSTCDETHGPCYELIGALEPGCSDLDHWKVEIDKIELGYMGLIIPVTIYITPPADQIDLGYIDLRFKWYATCMSFCGAEPAEFLTDCDWEYWSYRYNQSPETHLKLFAVAGAGAVTSCKQARAELFKVNFLLSTSVQCEDMTHQLPFYFPAIGDGECLINTFKNTDLDSILYTNKVFNAWDYEITPGTPDYTPIVGCVPAGAEAINFYGGAVDFVDLLGSDVRGDINLNGIRFDMGDLIMFQNYWISGLSAFPPDNLDKRIEATDINCDGIVLSVADWVYMVRIVFGYVSPLCPGWGPSGKGSTSLYTTLSSESDTIGIKNSSGEPGDQDKPIEINLTNEFDLAGLQVHLEYDPDVLDPVMDPELNDGKSVTFELVGRAADYETSGGNVIVQSRAAGDLLIYFMCDDESVTTNISSGSGSIIKVFFDVKHSAPTGMSLITPVDDGYDINSLSTLEGQAIAPVLSTGNFWVLKSIPFPSCPVLYRFDGTDFVQENPLLTACEKSGYQEIVTDYYQLTSPPDVDNGIVRFQLRELEDEITYLDDLRLLTVDHSQTTRVATSVDGQIFTYAESAAPLSAYDNEGIDRLDQVRAVDGNMFTATDAGYLIVTFANNGSGAKGFNTNTAAKIKCLIPFAAASGFLTDAGSDEGDIVTGQLTVALLDNQGNWVELPQLPPREEIRQEVLFSELTASIESSVLTLRISWEDTYTTDAVTQLVPSQEQPIISTWPISSFELSTAEVTPNLWQGFSSDNPLILRKGDILDFSFSMEKSVKPELVRDYIIVATGRYEPDYSVHASLLPDAVTLFDNYPNPFNPVTTISFSLPVASQVKLEVFNVLGQRIATLVDSYQPSGYQRIDWDAGSLASGLYFYRLTVDNFIQTKKMMLMK